MKKMKEESKKAQQQKLVDAKKVANLDKEARSANFSLFPLPLSFWK